MSPSGQLDKDKKMRREIANSNERRRMQSINAGFQALKVLIPHQDGEKLSKVIIDLFFITVYVVIVFYFLEIFLFYFLKKVGKGGLFVFKCWLFVLARFFEFAFYIFNKKL